MCVCGVSACMHIWVCIKTHTINTNGCSLSQVTQLSSVLNSLLPSRKDEDSLKTKDKDGDGQSLGIGVAVMESIFLTSIYWSLGACLIEESRAKFDSYVKKLSNLSEVSGKGAVAGPGEIPNHHPTLFEYFFDQELSKWVPWEDKVPEYVHQRNTKFNEILVPTVDTVRNTWLLQLMVNIQKPVVFVGETGTSKTATTQNFLRQLDAAQTVSVRE